MEDYLEITLIANTVRDRTIRMLTADTPEEVMEQRRLTYDLLGKETDKRIMKLVTEYTANDELALSSCTAENV